MANFINGIYKYFENLPFDTLVYTVAGAYAAVFVLALVLCLVSKNVKKASKRPFLCFTNAFTALICATFLLKCELGASLIVACVFWVVGYLLYGLLCLLSGTKERVVNNAVNSVSNLAVAEPPARQTVVQRQESLPNSSQSVPKNSVRLEHAAAVTDKLLSKNLSKTDRQELEKLKNTLAVLQIKGTLTAGEAEILNENFNALLKLMAKYNV